MKISPGIFRVLPLFVLLFPSSPSGAQQSVSPVVQQIKKKTGFEAPEKMFVHLDRPTYIVGETIWLKMLVTDENLRSSSLSTIGYLELINGEQQAVIQSKVELKDGKGDGAIQIPGNLASGHYLVRGYTNWMKNFSQSHFFETSILLINPFTSSEEEGISSIKKDQEPDIQFFAEGGRAVSNIPSKVAFKVQSADGKGMDVNGKLMDENGQVILSFKPLRNGIGHFIFTPQKGVSYKTEITDSRNKTFTAPLQIVQDEGHVIRLKDDTDAVELSVISSGNIRNSRYHLLIYKGEKSSAFQLNHPTESATFKIPKSTLQFGVNALVLFDQDLNPIAERLYFHALPSDPRVDVSLEKTSFKKREKVAIDLKSLALSDTIESSIAVFLTDSLPTPGQPSINTYLLMTSELKGQIENCDGYFQMEEPAQKEAIDNLMLTHGWRRYKSDQILRENFSPRYLPELDGHLITGRVVSSNGSTPHTGRAVFASFPSRKTNPWVTISDKQGRFILETRNFSGPKELVFQNNSRTDSTSRIIVDNPFVPVTESQVTLQPLSFTDFNATDLLKRSINMQTLNSYFPQKRIEATPDSSAFFGKADYTYFLDDYTRFPTMEEVLSEYIPSVLVRLRKGKYYTRVIETGIHKQLFTEDPLLFLDGVPLFDTDRIIAFDPLKIKKAEVVNRMYYLGPLAFPGIVSYSSYTGDLAGLEMDPAALVVAYHGTLEKREFYSPKYDREEKNALRRADFRNLLFWSPSVSIPPEGSRQINFFTSDQSGSYKIVIQGLSKDGIPVSTTSQLTVTD